MKQAKRIFVLDTNVLMYDPAAFFKFAEHDVYLPMAVLEELDVNKKGMSEPARNARQASRFMNGLLQAQTDDFNLDDGLPLNQEAAGLRETGREFGRLYFQTQHADDTLPTLPGSKADNVILANTITLQKQYPKAKVTLVSKDINLRIKAAVLRIHSDDYYNDKRIDDTDVLFGGTDELPDDFWPTHSKNIESWSEEGRTFYRVHGPETGNWHVNQFIYSPTEGEGQLEAIVRETNDEEAVIELTKDFGNDKNNIWGIKARNREQNFALNLLMDDNVDLVTILGQAGTGKTLLTLAAGLSQTLDHNRFREIVMTRVTIPLGEDIGFLPGTEEEKMEPWMGALMDNLEVLSQSHANEWERGATADLIRHRIKIRSLNFMRGRTFLNRFVIVDEAQNLTPKQMKAIITRAGPGSKIVCIGNIAQIDTPYLTETTTGLTYVVNRFLDWQHSGHVTLLRGERSRLADYAADNL